MAARRLTTPIASLLADESGLVTAMEMTVGIMLSFVLIVTAVILIAYSIMGIMVDDAALVSARAGSQFLFPSQSTQAVAMAQQVFAAAIPHGAYIQTVSCSALNVTTPTSTSAPNFTVSSNCSVDMGTFLGQRIATSWTAKASVPVGPYSVGN